MPLALDPQAAATAGFKGPVFHSSAFRDRLPDVLDAVKPLSDDKPGEALIIGGGKSAQEYVESCCLPSRALLKRHFAV